MCTLLDSIYRKLIFVIRSGNYLTAKFKTVIGLPQGDPLSPVLFSLFIHDLPNCFPHLGSFFHGLYISYIMFADDLCVIAESAVDLQSALNSLQQYCDRNSLRINVTKTKCMIFCRGQKPMASFSIGNTKLDVTNEFTYLGFNFTTQLSFSNHLNSVTAKANSRCGILNARLPIKNLPLHLVLQIYSCYVLPLFRYGLPLFLSSCSQSAQQKANSSFTKFLKSYLGIPFHSNNAITHFLTNTNPLMHTLEILAPHCIKSLSFPPELNNYKISFLSSTSQNSPYNPIPLIPSFFWHSRTFHTLPTTYFYRKRLCLEIYDHDHSLLCKNEKFHLFDPQNCICLGCQKTMSHYHKYDCNMPL